MDPVLPEASTPFGGRVRRRLREARTIWFTTVGGDGTPQPNPVWFLWDGDTFLIYNVAPARRLRHIRDRAEVSLNLDTDGKDGGIIVITGHAEISDSEPPANEVPGFMDKYGDLMVDMNPVEWGRHFSVAVRVRPLRVRGQ